MTTGLLDFPRLEAILAKLPDLHIGVLGDFSLDAYFYADMRLAELSRETPLYNRPVVRERYSLGGAANVAWNLADLGIGQVRAFSLAGADWRGRLLRQLLDKAGVLTDDLLEQPGWSTPLYGKVILTSGELQQEDARLDFANPAPPPPAAARALVAAVAARLPDLDALAIADYLPSGVLGADGPEALNRLAAQHPQVHFLVDSRARIGQFAGMVLKPNALEAARAVFPDREPQLSYEALRAAGQALAARAGKPVYLTRGAQGALLLDGEHAQDIPAVAAGAPVDPVGAGDTFLAALAAGLAAGAAPAEAGALACLAAGVTVRKLHVTGTASPAELRAALQEATENKGKGDRG